MITLQDLRKLKNNEGLTLKNGKAINYKTGWQVADHGIQTKSVLVAFQAVKAFRGNCGIWFSDGIYYIDHSFRVNTKKQAMTIGKKHDQLSVLRWQGLKLFEVV